jgi:hypothetical protein
MSHPLPKTSTKSILSVGAARGFAIEAEDWSLVITAAHCLPWLPAADPGSDRPV